MSNTALIQLTELEKKIADELRCFTEDANRNNWCLDNEWTHGIKQRLAELGIAQGFRICTSGFKDCYESEWLYDLVWYHEDEDKFLKTVPLVVECEWGMAIKHIRYDFEKLLIANAEVRLMICQCWPDGKQQLWDFFCKAVNAFGNLKGGERFLIAVLDAIKWDFEFRCISGPQEGKS